MTIKTERKAIIDIGSNTIRLVVYSYNSSQGLVEHHNFKTVARLSMYIMKNGNLSADGINVLIDTLTKFKEILLDIHVKDVFVAATAAIRQARNQTEILELVKNDVGFNLQILSEEQEAYFGYFAVIHSTNISNAVTIDMGGGSTEVTYFKDKKIIHFHSFSFGAVSLKGKFIKGTTITHEEKLELIEYVSEQFHSLGWLNQLHVPIVTIGGSARNLALVDQQRKSFPLNGIHQYELKNEDLQEISFMFAQYSLDGLKKIDGLSSDRSDIIVPALETFRTFMEVVDAPLMVYSKKGLREGIIFSQLAERFPEDFNKNEVTKKSIRHILGKFHVNEEEVSHLYDIFQKIYLSFVHWKYIDPIENDEFLFYAYQLYHIGKHIDQDAVSQHTFYLITNLSIDGISNEERLKFALLASYQNRDTFKRYVNSLPSYLNEREFKQLRDIGALFKFTKGLDILSRSTINDVLLENLASEITITFVVSNNYMLEKYQAEKLKKHVGKICSKDVLVEFKISEEKAT
ncbi:Ppx/GppA family phosphatase [Psychrobacillus sp. FJAT-51614]|uniref:Ppx/GppA family phosphatase n=1 Tax=Psychrobacillus mangrovi TaxID=3117745 RepID=A0ABU8EZW6_9BACI